MNHILVTVSSRAEIDAPDSLSREQECSPARNQNSNLDTIILPNDHTIQRGAIAWPHLQTFHSHETTLARSHAFSAEKARLG